MMSRASKLTLRRLLAPCLAGGCALSLVTCHPLFESAAQQKADADGYVYVMTTGSMLPKRVKKGSPEDTTQASATAQMGSDQFDHLRQQMTTGVPPGK